MYNKFQKLNGDKIPDIIEYVKSHLEKNPTSTITVGCDSVQGRRKTMYAISLMIYDQDIRRGAHVVFFRESCPKIRFIQERLYKEAQYLNDVGEYMNEKLGEFYKRLDLTDLERRRYKYHLLKSQGLYSDVKKHNEHGVLSNLILTEEDRIDFKLVDLHADFNPFPGLSNKNKSNQSYKSYIPWLRSLGFRVWCKPESAAASTASDFLLKNKKKEDYKNRI